MRRIFSRLVAGLPLKPEKDRRKDVRKLDSLIRDLHSIAQPGANRLDSK
jgi:hypothetical protein